MSSSSGEGLATEAWTGGQLVPAEGPLTEEQVLQRVDRIRVADAVVRASSSQGAPGGCEAASLSRRVGGH